MESSNENRADIIDNWDTFYKTYTEGGETTFEDADGQTHVIHQVDAYLELTQSLGQFSAVFKDCYESADSSIYHLWLFVRHYESIANYLINLVPNILAYALYFNSWSLRI